MGAIATYIWALQPSPILTLPALRPIYKHFLFSSLRYNLILFLFSLQPVVSSSQCEGRPISFAVLATGAVMVATALLSIPGQLSVSPVRIVRRRRLSCSASSTYSSPFHPEVSGVLLLWSLSFPFFIFVCYSLVHCTLVLKLNLVCISWTGVG